MNSNQWHAANLLTASRLAAAPILLGLAWFNKPIAFLTLLAAVFFTDLLDGYVARRLKQTSSFGAQLDSWSDGVIYSTIAISTWWLWPDIVQDQVLYVWIVIGSFTLPTIIGISKFKTLTSYHTWSVKVAAAAMGLSLYPLFLFKISWPFHLAVFVCVLAAIEEIGMTVLMSEPHSNIGSIVRVFRERQSKSS